MTSLWDNIQYRVYVFRFEAAIPVVGYILLGAFLANVKTSDIFLLFLIAVGLEIATNSISEALDYDIDMVGRPQSQIVKGNVTRKNAIIQGLIVYLLSVFATLYFFPNTPVILVVFAITLISFLYIYPPISFKKYGLWGPSSITLLFALLFVMPLLVNKDYLNSNEVLWFGFVFSNTFIAMLCKDFKDYNSDRQSNIKTPVVLYGPKNVSKFVEYTIFIPLALAAIYALKNYFSVLCFVLIPLLFTVKATYMRLLTKDPLVYGKQLADWGRIDRFLFPLAFAFLVWGIV